MSALKHALAGMLVLAVVAPVLATPVTYDATIVIEWYNGYAGTRVTTENNGTVTVNYTGGGAFEITALTFSEAVSNLGTMVLNESSTWASTGTISAGVANGTLGYKGTIAGSYNLTNEGGAYSGTVANGVSFSQNDVYALTAFNAGTVSPAIAGQGQWNHLIDQPENTRIIFGVPEPASLGLLALGLPLFIRRRR